MTNPNHGGARPGAGRKKGFKREKMWRTEQELAKKYQNFSVRLYVSCFK
jgi:hypothetical protein